MIGVVVVATLLLLVLLRASVIAVSLRRERRVLDAGGAPLPAVSVVIPLFGWDERLPDTIRALRSQAARAGVDCEVIVVVDDDHPRRAELTGAGARALAPTLPAAPSDVDKVRRLRSGARAARHPLVLLLDSDVVIVDEDWLVRRLAAHARDPSLRLTFPLPAYHQARSFGDAVLASYTLHNNLVVYWLGWWLIRRGTSIAAAQAVRNDDGVLPALLDGIRGSLADDHALGFSVERRGEIARPLPMTVCVHATDTRLRATSDQIVRWLTAAKTVGPLLSPSTAAWLALTSILSGAGSGLVGAAAVTAVLGRHVDAAALVVGALLVPACDGVCLTVLESIVGRRRPRWFHAWAVPVFVLLQPVWLLRALRARRVVWRGRDNDVDDAARDARATAGR